MPRTKGQGAKNGSRSRGLAEKILVVLKEQPNQSITVSELEQRLGLNRQQIQSAMYSLMKNAVIGPQIERAGNGMYKYHSHPLRPKGKLFELLAETHDGRLILQDDGGNVFIATEA